LKLQGYCREWRRALLWWTSEQAHGETIWRGSPSLSTVILALPCLALLHASEMMGGRELTIISEWFDSKISANTLGSRSKRLEGDYDRRLRCLSTPIPQSGICQTKEYLLKSVARAQMIESTRSAEAVPVKSGQAHFGEVWQHGKACSDDSCTHYTKRRASRKFVPHQQQEPIQDQGTPRGA